MASRRKGARARSSMPFPRPAHDAPFDVQRYTRFGIGRDAERAGLEIVALLALPAGHTFEVRRR